MGGRFDLDGRVAIVTAKSESMQDILDVYQEARDALTGKLGRGALLTEPNFLGTVLGKSRDIIHGSALNADGVTESTAYAVVDV